MQTPRQVIDSLLRKKHADRVGFHDWPWGDTLTAWVQQGYPVDDKGQPADFAKQAGLDMVNAGGWFNHYPRMEVYELVEETDAWHVHRDGWGALLKYWKNKSGTPEHVGFHMTTRAIWEQEYRPRLLALDPGRVKVEESRKNLAARKAENVWTHFGHLFGFETMRQSMGDTCLYESVLLEPEWIHDVNTVLTAFQQTHYRYLFEQAGLPDGIWMYEDLGYKHATFCSPDVYRRLFFPYYRQMTDFFHSYNLPVVLHSCGFVEPLLDLIVEAGFDALHPMETKAGNDPFRIARKYKDKLALIGGLDIRILESHDHALIRAKTAELIDGMKALGARYIFASDHSLSTNMHYQDFQVALETYHQHMAY
jgi:uroporphyrinogen decarboxylase